MSPFFFTAEKRRKESTAEALRGTLATYVLRGKKNMSTNKTKYTLMKNISIFLMLICIGISSSAQNTIINDPNAELRTVTTFNAIEVSDGIDLFLSQGGEEALAVSAAGTAFRDAITTTVEDGVLRIWYNHEGRIWVSGNKRMRAYVSFKKINRLKASNASDVLISGPLRADVLLIELSGASDLKGRIEANKLELEQSGASDANVSGKVTELIINASGASDLQGYGLQSDICTVNASGASDVRVTVNKELTANANGASSVKYHGKPVVHSTKSSRSGRLQQ
jgi:hypothetical protein